MAFWRKPKLAAFSLDYDGTGDCLFTTHPKFAEYAIYRNTLNGYLDSITENADAAVLYSGSARQMKSTDKSNAKRNKNGLCYLNYEILAARKYWFFNNLRVTPPLSLYSEPPDEIDEKAYEIQTKIEILLRQLADAAKNHPNYSIDFHFIDDRKDIVDGVRSFFKANPHTIPENIKLHLRRFRKVKNEDNVNDAEVQNYGSIQKPLPPRSFSQKAIPTATFAGTGCLAVGLLFLSAKGFKDDGGNQLLENIADNSPEALYGSFAAAFVSMVIAGYLAWLATKPTPTPTQKVSPKETWKSARKTAELFIDAELKEIAKRKKERAKAAKAKKQAPTKTPTKIWKASSQTLPKQSKIQSK